MKPHYFSRLLVLFLCAATAVWADNVTGLPEAPPESVGLSSKRLERIDEVMREHVAKGDMVGALGMIARNGKVAYLRAWGMADRENAVPMRPDTIFRIYSMSKPITSVALMTLFEEGRFALKDPVSKYLPEFADLKVAVSNDDEESGPAFNLPETDAEGNPVQKKAPAREIETVPVKHPMTVQDLLRHTAGLTYGFFGNTAVDKMYRDTGILVFDKDLTEMVHKLSRIPLLYQPGTTWHYSVAADVQGRLIEVLSGQSFDVFLDERIFKPLGMVDTAFYVPEEKKPRFAQMYSPDNDTGALKPANRMLSRNFVKRPTLFSGGGGLVSTAADYMRFCQMMLNGGELDGVRILSRKTVELMTLNHIAHIEGRPFSTGYGFGLGFAVAEDLSEIAALGSVGEFNWGGAAGTRFWIDPKEKFIGVYMIQILPHTGLTYGSEFKNLAYQAIADQAPGEE